MKSTRCILVLSSLPPEHSAGLGLDLMKALGCIGEVTYFSRWPSELKADNIKSMHRTWWQRVVAMFVSHRRYRRLFRTEMAGIPLVNGVRIIYPDELDPYESAKRVAGQIHGKYDYIVTLFWQYMFNSTTLRVLSEKLNCPVLIYAVDMAAVSGGCYYFNDCSRYMRQCGMCPGLDSHNPYDISRSNYFVKRANYQRCDAAFLGNTWMTECAERSGLFRSDRIFNVGLVLDTDLFRPVADTLSVRTELGIENKYRHIFFVRSAMDPRKGSCYVIEAVTALWKELQPDHRNEFLLVTVGNDDTIGESLRPHGIPVTHFGVVDRSTLIRLYQASTAFISPSTDDAGPSMVNQALCCGTPVIGFAVGVALDVVVNGVSGWRIKSGDSQALCRVLRECISMPQGEYEELRRTSRTTGVAHSSYMAINKAFGKVFEAYESSPRQ